MIRSIVSLYHNIEHFSVGLFIQLFTVMLMKIVEMLENHNSTTSGPSIDATFCQNAR